MGQIPPATTDGHVMSSLSNADSGSVPRHRNATQLSGFEERYRVSLAEVPIPEPMPDVVAALDLNHRAECQAWLLPQLTQA